MTIKDFAVIMNRLFSGKTFPVPLLYDSVTHKVVSTETDVIIQFFNALSEEESPIYPVMDLCPVDAKTQKRLVKVEKQVRFASLATDKLPQGKEYSMVCLCLCTWVPLTYRYYAVLYCPLPACVETEPHQPGCRQGCQGHHQGGVRVRGWRAAHRAGGTRVHPHQEALSVRYVTQCAGGAHCWWWCCFCSGMQQMLTVSYHHPPPLPGDNITEADIIEFVVLFRFDPLLSWVFPIKGKRITLQKRYPAIFGWLRDIYQQPGVEDTCDLVEIANGKGFCASFGVRINELGKCDRGRSHRAVYACVLYVRASIRSVSMRHSNSSHVAPSFRCLHYRDRVRA